RGDVPAQQLTKDDVLLLGKGLFADRREGTDEFGCVHLDERLTELLGLMVGDGCLMGEQESAMLTLSQQEAAVAARVQDNLHSFKSEHAPDGRGARECQVHSPQVTLRLGTSSRCVVNELKRFAVL